MATLIIDAKSAAVASTSVPAAATRLGIARNLFAKLGTALTIKSSSKNAITSRLLNGINR
jgi:hypothetical protein